MQSYAISEIRNVSSLSVPVLMIAAPFIGSFLGVLIMRVPDRRPVLMGRSECESCKHPLAVTDMVPLLSWAQLRGRCRYCHAGLGLFYPAMEFAAIVIAFWAATLASGAVFIASCVLGWTLLVLGMIDFQRYLLPDPLVLFLLITGLISMWWIDPSRIVEHVVGAGAGFIAFATIAYLYRRLRGRDGLGLGDAKFLGAIGAWLSWEGLPTTVLFAAVAGLVVTCVKAIRDRTFGLGDRLPFGSLLAAAAWIVWLYGPLS